MFNFYVYMSCKHYALKYLNMWELLCRLNSLFKIRLTTKNFE